MRTLNGLSSSPRFCKSASICFTILGRIRSASARARPQVGSAGQAANFAATTAQGVLTQVQSVQQSISGVNLDEQAADLVSYQQAYQAAAQIIASAQVLFQSLLTAVQAG